jgi:hypothetical protein
MPRKSRKQKRCSLVPAFHTCLQTFQDVFGTKVTGVLVNIIFSILSIFQVKLPTKYQKKIKNKFFFFFFVLFVKNRKMDAVNVNVISIG